MRRFAVVAALVLRPLGDALQEEAEHLLLQRPVLLEHGLGPDVTNTRGFTPLHGAAEGGHVEIVRLLLEAGADPAVEAQGYKPRDVADMSEQPDVVEVLDEWQRGEG